MKVLAKPNARSIVGWLNPEEVLTVLAITSVPTGGAKFLIWSNQQSTVALFPATDFEIKDENLSPSWIAGVDANGYIVLAPRDWQVDGFWERYYEGDQDAEKIFAAGMTSILNE